jgi:23S rRNA (cytosine1962-C5)-methyltransferase
VKEWGIWYALGLTLNQDSSFYLDMRNLRRWLLESCSGCDVLNTFAYTGSLGVAALAGGARFVLQTDRNRAFLALARTSCMLNHLDLGKMKLEADDFFTQMSQLRRQGELFDLVLLDPPFFSVSSQGVVNQQEAGWRLINKVRPLVRDGGRIVAVNNSLYLSGEAFMRSIDELCAEGFMQVEQIIPVPADVTGTPATICRKPPVPVEPFNHPTKIVVLRVWRK